MSQDWTIRACRVFLVPAEGAGGDYHRQRRGHWLIDTPIANPMSGYPEYRASRTSWGIGVLGSIVVELEAACGVTGVATGFGGPPAAWLVNAHLSRFVLGTDARRVNRIWDQMHRATMFYGRTGLPMAAISVVDLALWDLLGRLRGEPVVDLIGGACRDETTFYCTGPRPEAARAMGFWGGKVPLPHGPAEGEAGLRANVAFLSAHRDAVGPGYPLMVDCYMALDVPYATRLVAKCRDLDIYWWEEALHPGDADGYRALRAAHPDQRWTTGEHDYARYGFRPLIEGRLVDVLQPDMMWAGGLTETLRIAAHAAAYDLPVIPHGSGPYAYHFVASQPHLDHCEYVAASPDGRSILPVFGSLFADEPMPEGGRIGAPRGPGFGMDLADRAALTLYEEGLTQ